VAEFVTIDGQQYMKRQPLGVLGLTLITFGIYFFYWYYKIVDEIRRFEKDDSVRPGMALLAVTLGALILVPRSSPCTTRRCTSSGWSIGWATCSRCRPSST
jgi:H+/Cl- antiporter ClcA